jgi:hypothetical protein
MPVPHRHVDAGSMLVIAITLLLFVAALATKGLTHDMLLEAGVFLVSVKLIIMGYKNGISTAAVERQLEEITALLRSHAEDGR